MSQCLDKRGEMLWASCVVSGTQNALQNVACHEKYQVRHTTASARLSRASLQHCRDKSINHCSPTRPEYHSLVYKFHLLVAFGWSRQGEYAKLATSKTGKMSHQAAIAVQYNLALYLILQYPCILLEFARGDRVLETWE